jgi:hypothetical protein
VLARIGGPTIGRDLPRRMSLLLALRVISLPRSD